VSVATGPGPARMELASPPDRERVLSPLARAAARFLVIAAAGAVMAWALVHVRLVVVPFIVALLLATLLAPPADALRRNGMPSGLATMSVLLAAIGVLVALVTLIAPPVAGELGRLTEAVDEGIDVVTRWIARGPFGLSDTEVDRLLENAGREAGTGASSVAGGLLSASLLALEVVAGILLTIVLTFFLVHDGSRIWGWAMSLAPVESRERMAAFGTDAWSALSSYTRGVAAVALFDAVLIGIALALIGVPLVLPLAVLTFIAAFVPLLGAFVAGAVAALVALVDGGITDAALVVLAITLIQQLEGNLLYPVVVGRAIELHAVAILLAVTAGGVLLGVVGAALAVPVAAVTWAGVKAWRDHPRP
jgi:putative heme transporter